MYAYQQWDWDKELAINTKRKARRWNKDDIKTDDEENGMHGLDWNASEQRSRGRLLWTR
jgi:hypothetical protein